jgi:hypothetical protein
MLALFLAPAAASAHVFMHLPLPLQLQLSFIQRLLQAVPQHKLLSRCVCLQTV